MSNFNDRIVEHKGVTFMIREYHKEGKESVKVTEVNGKSTHICFWCAHRYWKPGEAEAYFTTLIDNTTGDMMYALREEHAKARSKMLALYARRTRPIRDIRKKIDPNQ